MYEVSDLESDRPVRSSEIRIYGLDEFEGMRRAGREKQHGEGAQRLFQM